MFIFFVKDMLSKNWLFNFYFLLLPVCVMKNTMSHSVSALVSAKTQQSPPLSSYGQCTCQVTIVGLCGVLTSSDD